jgi:putative DNA primase/helicase
VIVEKLDVKGRWKDILLGVGLPASSLTGKVGPCPFCGGKDRWVWDNKDGRGTSYCRQEGARDGFQLVMALRQCDFKEAVEIVRPLVGSARAAAGRPSMTPEKRKRLLNGAWDQATQIMLDDPVDRYLRSRLGQSFTSRALRTKLDDDGSAIMLARVVDADGKPATLHRTYITAAGQKIAGEGARKLMPGALPESIAIRLVPIPTGGDELGIAEGIETAIAAHILTGIPVWSVLNEGYLQKFQPPPGIRRVIVFGDNDANFVGQAAAYILGRRMVHEKYLAEIRIPSIADDDWNDVLRARFETAVEQ